MTSARLKKFGTYLFRTLLGLLLLIALLIGFAGTETALRWGVQLVERMTQGKLVVGGVQGSLYDTLKIETLTFANDEKRFELKQLQLVWSPLALSNGHLLVPRMTLQELRIIELKPSTEPLQLPDTLHVPLAITAPLIQIERLVMQQAAAEQSFSAIDLGLKKTGDRYQLQLRNVASTWGRAQAVLELQDERPYTLKAHAAVQQTEGGTYDITADVSGTLSQLLLQAKATALAGQADIQAELAPFAAFPLTAANIQAVGINPAVLRKDLPQADLSADIVVQRQGTEEISGKITLRNKRPGAWDQARLPLRSLTAQFSGALTALDLQGLQMDLGGAGVFKGTGQLREQQLQLTLSTSNFNPQGVHSKMRPMQLAGDIRLLATPDQQQLGADLRYQRFKLHLDAQHQDAALTLSEASVQSGAGQLSLHGSLALQGAQAFQMAGALQGFNPADFGDYPLARVNASFAATGNLTAAPQAKVTFAIANSQFRQQPLTGQGSFSVSAQRVWDSALQLGLARNRLEAKGALGNVGDQLSLVIEAENLAAFAPALAGQVQASGVLSGRFAAPAGNFVAQVKNLAWGKDYRVANLMAKGRLDQGVDGPLQLESSVQDLLMPQLQLAQASLHAQGTRQQHSLQFLAKNKDIDVESRLLGTWRDEAGWGGQIQSLVNRGQHALTLQAPAKLEVGKQHVWLGDARIKFAGADFMLQRFSYDAGQWASRGTFKGLALNTLQGFAQRTDELKTNLTFGGEWQFALQDKANGRVALWREGGDITLPTIPRSNLGLSRIALTVEAINNQLQVELAATGSQLGKLKANAQSTLSQRNAVWGIAGDAAVRGNADLSIASLAWLGPLMDKTGALTFDGVVQAAVRVAGTFAQPALTGTITGERFSLARPDLGLRFSDGRFQALLRDEALLLNSLSVRAGAGSLTGQGRFSWAGDVPRMQIALQADKLEILSRPDRLLIMSGNGEATLADKKLLVSAKLKADRGLIELPKGDVPTPSEDVVVLGQTQVAEKKKLPFAARVDLDLDMGERFFIKGGGLDAQLGGSLKLVSVDGAVPSTRGSIRVIKGAYSAYGQRLEIDRGILKDRKSVV